jgi:hypothetical protein
MRAGLAVTVLALVLVSATTAGAACVPGLQASTDAGLLISAARRAARDEETRCAQRCRRLSNPTRKTACFCECAGGEPVIRGKLVLCR